MFILLAKWGQNAYLLICKTSIQNMCCKVPKKIKDSTEARNEVSRGIHGNWALNPSSEVYAKPQEAYTLFGQQCGHRRQG